MIKQKNLTPLHRRASSLILFFTGLFFVACGVKGRPEPPLKNVAPTEKEAPSNNSPTKTEDAAKSKVNAGGKKKNGK